MRARAALWTAYVLMWQPGAHAEEPAWPSTTFAETTDSHWALVAEPKRCTVASPQSGATQEGAREFLDILVQQVPICIARTQPWAGDLGPSILYRIVPRDSRHIHVGYFAYWTTERPWGDNALTHWLLPALVIDAFYSHLLFIFPGIQRLMYGAGDVEGVRIAYRLDDSNRLIPVEITADDATHREVSLSLNEAVDSQGRITLLNDVWSHQLGGRQALNESRIGAHRHCFNSESLRPLTGGVVAAFRLGSPSDPRRAGPAWRI